MIRHIWSVLCRETSIDNETQNLSVLNVLERLSVTAQPISKDKYKKDNFLINVPINFEIVSMWVKKDKNKKINTLVKFLLLDPSGKLSKEYVKEMELISGIKRLRSRIKFNGVTLSKTGEYTFEVRLKENGDKDFKLVASIPLDVEINIQKEQK